LWVAQRYSSKKNAMACGKTIIGRNINVYLLSKNFSTTFMDKINIELGQRE
jgi:hypothetical protein